MEAEYRQEKDVTTALTAEQMADSYVRLKHGIDGDFYVQEVTDERIVLGNRRCPFGEGVTRVPSLCMMTSSVFGAIARANGAHGEVELQERIALGDPECKVIVHLQPNEAAEQPPTMPRTVKTIAGTRMLAPAKGYR